MIFRSDNQTLDCEIPVRQMLEQKRSAEVIDQWIREKQKEIYVQIDPAWRGCDFEYPGWVK